MLRITLQDLSTGVTIKLEGRIAGESVVEFERTWETIHQTLAERRLCLDLRGVTFITAEGRQLLARIHRETHNDFVTNSPLTNFLAQEASGQRNVQQRERI